MKRSRVIALAGISAALAYIAVLISFYVDMMTLSLNAVAAVAIMLPLTTDSVKSALFALFSAGALAMLTIGIYGSLWFAIFFGSYTVIAYLLDFRLYRVERLPKVLRIAIITVVKLVYFTAAFVAMWYIMDLFVNMDGIEENIPVWLFVVISYIAFSLYDLLMRLVYINLRRILKRRIFKD